MRKCNRSTHLKNQSHTDERAQCDNPAQQGARFLDGFYQLHLLLFVQIMMCVWRMRKVDAVGCRFVVVFRITWMGPSVTVVQYHVVPYYFVRRLRERFVSTDAYNLRTHRRDR